MNQSTLRVFRVLALTSMIFAGFASLGIDRVFAKSEAGQQETQLININKADTGELQLIRGIGPALADRIITYRNENGAFKSTDDLMNVRGIGASKMEYIKNQVTI